MDVRNLSLKKLKVDYEPEIRFDVSLSVLHIYKNSLSENGQKLGYFANFIADSLLMWSNYQEKILLIILVAFR